MKNKVSFNSELSKFGIGLFETIKIEDVPLDLDLHMDRMFNSIEALGMNNKETYDKGFKLTISPIKRGNSIIYKHKTTNYYENIYTKRYANKNNFDDGVFVNCEDVILECSMSNIFFIKENKVYTPNRNLPILNGIMKKRILEICKKLNIEVVETEIRLQDIQNYDFAFISNSLMKAIKVTKIDDVIYNSYNEIFDKIISFV